MRCIFAGTPAAAVPTLHALNDSDHEVVAVLTRPPARVGRGRKIASSPVHEAATELGLDVLTPATLQDADVQEQIRALNADIVVVVAYGQIVPEALLDVPTHGWVNLHFSLLPRWRGAAPVQRAIMAGDDLTGVSVFQIEKGLDTGPVYAQDPFLILPGATTSVMLDKLGRQGAAVMVQVLNAIETGQATARPQPEEGVTYASMMTSEDGHLDFTRPGEELERIVRALAPKPGGWALLNGNRMKITHLACLPTSDLEPGQIRCTKTEVAVGTATCDLAITEIAAPGKKIMAGADWARGAHLGEDAAFEVAK